MRVFDFYLKIINFSELLFSFFALKVLKIHGKKSRIGLFSKVLGGEYIYLGDNSTFGKYSEITCWDNYKGENFKPSLIIGNNCSFGNFCHISCINSIVIGNDVLTGRRVTITDNSHGVTDIYNLGIPPIQRKLFSKGGIIIEDNVWIGENVVILGGITIGKGSVIGANSVVTKNVEEYKVYAGVPAKKVG